MSQKSIPIILLLLFLFTSCNYPLSQEQMQQQVVETQVAAILTAAQTSLPVAEQTEINAETPNPPGTAETPALTNTSTTTSTPTVTPTQGDPSTMYGAAFWNNTLDNGSGFGLSGSGYDDGYTSITIQNGKMVLTSLTATGWKGWRLTDRGLANYYLEGTFIIPSCAGGDLYGLVFRSPDYSSGFGYYLGLTCDGKYSLQRWDSGGLATLISSTASPLIKSGSGQTNRLGIHAKGAALEIFINGESAQTITDGSYLNATIIGVFIAGKDSLNFSAQLDEIKMWSIP